MKKLYILLCVLLLVSCGGNEKAETIIESQEGIESAEVSKNTTEIKTDTGAEITTTNDMTKSIDVPEEFPQDILPIIKGAIVIASQTNPDGTISLIMVSEDPYEDVLEYYEKVLEDAETLMVTKDAESFMSMGELEGITYNVAISKDVDDEYETSILLLGSPVDLMDNETEDESADLETEDDMDKAPAEFVVPDDIVWPENYPEDLTPYALAYTHVKDVESDSSETVISLMTEGKFEDVVEYYEEILSTTMGFASMVMPAGQSFSGRLDDKTIMLMILKNSGQEDARYKTLIQIIYY